MVNKPKIIVIVGPTSSGKTGLAVRLAARFNGEIVSADSRQVYRGMDIGTGKHLKEYNFQFPISNFQLNSKSQNFKISTNGRKSNFIKIPYHLIDVVNPKETFDLAKYKEQAEAAIDDIIKRRKLPILVGGSGLYLQAVVDDFKLSKKSADKELRKILDKMTVAELYEKLKRLNPGLAEKINQSDRGNKRRLIRYVEIVSAGAKTLGEKNREGKYDALILGLDRPVAELNKRIEYRLLERLEKEGMIAEVRRLHDEGVSWRRLESFGLEYKFISQHLQGKYDYNEMVKKLNIAIRQFARRQRSWFRRWERQGRMVCWIDSTNKVEKLIRTHLKK